MCKCSLYLFSSFHHQFITLHLLVVIRVVIFVFVSVLVLPLPNHFTTQYNPLKNSSRASQITFPSLIFSLSLISSLSLIFYLSLLLSLSILSNLHSCSPLLSVVPFFPSTIFSSSPSVFYSMPLEYILSSALLCSPLFSIKWDMICTVYC